MLRRSRSTGSGHADVVACSAACWPPTGRPTVTTASGSHCWCSTRRHRCGCCGCCRCDNAEQQLALWTRIVRHTLPAQRPAVLGLLGMAAWQNGDGALAMVCLEQLDRIDPLEPIAALLDWLNDEVVPPQAWPQRA